MIAIKNILVPTDFGEAADAALTYGRELASRFGATLHLLHVVDNLQLSAFGEGYGEIAVQLLTDLETAAREQLDQRLIDSDHSGPPTTGAVVTALAPVARASS